MKFDVIIGNPPYQLSDGGHGMSAKPIYQFFVRQAKKLNPRFLVMIIPARWFSGGKGLDDFRAEMLEDTRIREIHDYFNAEDCFPGIDLSGGVCYFLWNRDNKGECKVVSIKGNKQTAMKRQLLFNGGDTFIRFNEAISILEKIKLEKFKSFADNVSSRRPFGLPTSVAIKKQKGSGDIKIYAYPENGFYSKNKLERNIEWVDKWKVLCAKAYGERGDFPYLVISKPFIAEKQTCCSETYIVMYICNTEVEAKNVITYIQTRFFRFLVLLKKNTQDATSKVYSCVPMQDFSEPWTDEKLYKKYNLTKDEISFIESMIRPMEMEE